MTRLSLPRAAVLTLFLLAGIASAQIDARARELLEGLMARFDLTVNTVDDTTKATIYDEDGNVVAEAISRTIRDFVNRRAATIYEAAPGMTLTTVLKDGQVRMTMTGMPMALPVPPGTADNLEALLEPTVWGGFKDGDVATYDGHQSYGDLLSGDQVSYTTTEDTGFAGVVTTTTRFIFTPTGGLYGYYLESEDSPPVMFVYDEPLEGGYLVGQNSNLYSLNGSEWKLTTRFEAIELKVNEPLDETVFE